MHFLMGNIRKYEPCLRKEGLFALWIGLGAPLLATELTLYMEENPIGTCCAHHGQNPLSKLSNCAVTSVPMTRPLLAVVGHSSSRRTHQLELRLHILLLTTLSFVSITCCRLLSRTVCGFQLAKKSSLESREDHRAVSVPHNLILCNSYG